MPRSKMLVHTRVRVKDAVAWLIERRVVVAVTLVLAALPLVRMVHVARRSSRTQYNDYWPMLDALLGPDGGFRPQGIFEFRNEHPIFVPKLAYWLNVELFNGSNHTLAAGVVVVVAVQVAMIALIALAAGGFSRWSGAMLVVSASALLFAPNGAWNFVKAMSGTAWLSANLWVLAALLAQQRERRFLAPALGLLATFSYGTGLAVWPALVVSALVRSPKQTRAEWPTFVGGAGSLLWYAVWYGSRSEDGGVPPRPSASHAIGATLEGVGSVIADGTAARILGAIAVLVIAACGARLARSRPAVGAPWLGLATFGIVANVLVALGRSGLPALDTTAGRYSSVSALTWVALVALVLTSLPRRAWVALVPIPLLLAVSLGGSDSVRELDRSTRSHDLLALAMRIGVADGQRVQGGFQPFPVMTDRLAAIGHQPFDRDLPLACGLLGLTVDAPHGRQPANAIPGQVRSRPKPRAEGAVSLVGTLDDRGRDVECLLVLDEADVVVGAGVLGPRTPEGTIEFETLAPEGTGSALYVRVAGSDRLIPVRFR